MFRSSTRQALRTWIALVAFVFSLFAPSLSHAFAPQQSMPMSEVCTAAGMMMMPMADSADQHAGSAKGMTHCDLCCSHHAPVVLPAPPLLPLTLAGARDTYPPLFYQSPSPQFAWTPAQSRAPPASFF
ncbi:DUF2946 domain-containing protein [Massilia sp. IC2-477]|uniref:DUF2946 domain-containing protein n=1 Tax=Massilia sp. IC2-477 TaxID=2887198 RepID=UPI001D117407|nr:DUF2946 domain-containing protein [Massilia sp. IC2-477]MCC2954384.1 DUF2946 domain-containing protein [Massilia sp. IC2-477]